MGRSIAVSEYLTTSFRVKWVSINEHHNTSANCSVLDFKYEYNTEKHEM